MREYAQGKPVGVETGEPMGDPFVLR